MRDDDKFNTFPIYANNNFEISTVQVFLAIALHTVDRVLSTLFIA